MWFKNLRADIAAAKRNDPAARNKFEIFLTYSGVHALSHHRFAKFLYRIHLKLLARIVSQVSKFFTGIEIPPAANIYPGVFIDHGCGVKSYLYGLETVGVERGQSVSAGDPLGTAGTAHNLIYELRIGSKSTDPQTALDGNSGLQFREAE